MKSSKSGCGRKPSGGNRITRMGIGLWFWERKSGKLVRLLYRDVSETYERSWYR